MQLLSKSLDETDTLGRQLARCLEPGMTIALNAELGSGKTQLTKAICDGLGVDESSVNSPTFVLMQLYTDGRLPVAHFDTYRLADQDEFVAIGGEEYLLDNETVCIVEWADRICDILPTDHLQITIQQTGETERAMTIVAGGDDSQAVLEKLKRVVETP